MSFYSFPTARGGNPGAATVVGVGNAGGGTTCNDDDGDEAGMDDDVVCVLTPLLLDGQ